MKVEELPDGGPERKVLALCIADSVFLARLVGKVPDQPFRSKVGNAVWQMCRDHYMEYRAAPDKVMHAVFTEKAVGFDRGLRDLLNRFLGALTTEVPAGDLNFNLGQAERYFNTVLLEKQADQVSKLLASGKADEAIQTGESFSAKRIRLHSPPFVDVLRDTAAQDRALLSRQRPLIKYQGPAGEFFGEEFAEDSFVAFMAPPKGKKSFVLLDVAWRAVRQGRKVAYFQVGDMSQDQVMLRFHARVAYRPVKDGVLKLPLSITLPPGNEPRPFPVVEREVKVYSEPMTPRQGRRAFENALKKHKGDIRLFCYPTRGVNVHGVRGVLDQLDQEGYRAEVVVVDYAGNLAPVDHKLVKHEQVDHTWAMMRQISEARKCLVVTAQQTNKEGFKSWVLTRNNFRDSLMILAHVTAFFGIQATDEESDQEVIRINTVASRGQKFVETNCLYCATALALASPIVCSALKGG